MRWPPGESSDGKIENQSQLETGFLIAAERELSAFFAAVNDMFGAEQARKSAIHWIEELELMDWPTENSDPNWRQATLAASSRLAADLAVAKRNGGI